MHLPLKTTASLILVAMLAAPAFAATNDSATVVNAVQTDAVPISTLTPIIGNWAAADLSFLDKASSIKVFDTKSLYNAADLKLIASAETNRSMQLNDMRKAILGDAALAAWFKAHQIDVNRVVAVNDPSGNAQIFLY
jgi:hypothetical protein